MNNFNRYTIRKASGETTLFSPEKLRLSLKNAGAQQDAIDRVFHYVEGQLYDGISTQKIYQIAFKHLKRERNASAARYKLKQGIMELGPSGFPFEHFMAEVLKAQGYHTSVGIFMQGLCVQHEIDIWAQKNQEANIIECKYHNEPGYTCDVKVPLYVHSRYRDIESRLRETDPKKYQLITGWLITNTKFSIDAIKYGICAGLTMIAWSYPDKNNLKSMVEQLRLYPLTCLTTITKTEKQLLLDRNILLCKDLLADERLLRPLNIKENRLQNILKECHSLTQLS